MLPLAEIAPEYLLFGAAGVVSVVAFGALILTPAIGAFGRAWEKLTVGMLSVVLFAALVALGVAVGGLIVFFWNDLSGIL